MANIKKNLSEFVSQSQDAKSSFNIGLSALKNGSYETAIKKFLHVLEIDRSEEMTRSVRPNLGQAYLLNGNANQAILEFRSALRLNPDSATRAFIHANMGYIYTQKQFYGFAISQYHHAIKENAKDLTSYLTLGMLYENKFQFAQATEAFRRVLKIEPENKQAKEAISRLEEAKNLPVTSKEEVIRLVQRFPTLGIIIAMTYDATYDGYFPMLIYAYPTSPLKEKINPGDKILNVLMSASQPVRHDDDRDICELLDSPPGTDVVLVVGEKEMRVTCQEPMNKTMDQQERLEVYRHWLKTFDSRLAWLWSAAPDIKGHIGPLWGNELESLVRELHPFNHTPVYDFAYALMIEHFQAFSITEGGVEKEIQYQINLGKDRLIHATPDMITYFSEMQFQYVANLLASRS